MWVIVSHPLFNLVEKVLEGVLKMIKTGLNYI